MMVCLERTCCRNRGMLFKKSSAFEAGRNVGPEYGKGIDLQI